MHDSNHKGNVAEAAITAEAIKLGIPVLRPLVEHTRYDLIFDLGPRLLRVQCKWAPLRNGVVPVPVQSSRYKANGEQVRRPYTSDEIDAIAVYCEELDECFLIPIETIEGTGGIHLRVAPTKNNQRAALRWATDYPLGAVAQLEERCHGMAEARGSSPLSSTQARNGSQAVGANIFRNHFGWYMERAAAGEEFLVTRRGRPYARLTPPPGFQPALDSAATAAPTDPL